MTQIQYDNNTYFLSPTWGDNKIFGDKAGELLFGQISDVAGTVSSASKNPLTKVTGGLIEATSKAAEFTLSDDKTKTVVVTLADKLGGAYAKSITKDITHAHAAEAASEIGGGKVASGMVEKMMDERPNSAHHKLFLSETQRQQKQQQDVKMLNSLNEGK